MPFSLWTDDRMEGISSRSRACLISSSASASSRRKSNRRLTYKGRLPMTRSSPCRTEKPGRCSSSSRMTCPASTRGLGSGEGAGASPESVAWRLRAVCMACTSKGLRRTAVKPFWRSASSSSGEEMAVQAMMGSSPYRLSLRRICVRVAPSMTGISTSVNTMA